MEDRQERRHSVEEEAKLTKINNLQEKDIVPKFKFPLEGMVWKLVSREVPLIPGDHIMYKDIYWKHAIVINVEGNNVKVIKWSLGIFLRNCVIQTKSFSITTHETMKACYNYGCYDNALVVRRAKSRLGETSYSLFSNFSKGFCEWCKTGLGSGSYDTKSADIACAGSN